MVTIYAYECTVTGMAYIGCTAGKLNKRAREHRCLLRSGKHSAPILQAEWDKNGEDTFRMVALEVGNWNTLADKRAAEQKWMDTFSTKGLLCNAAEMSFAPSLDAIKKGVANAHLEPGNRWSDEVNQKRRMAQLGKPKGHGAKISATKRARKAMR